MSLNSEMLKVRQSQMRSAMDKRGLSLKGVSFDSGIPYSTLLGYFPEPGGSTPSLMPISAQYALCGVVPDDILSLLLPDDRLIVRVPASLNHDDLAEAVADYLLTKERAHHPESECGREIGPGEDETLRGKVAHLKAVA